MIRIVTAVVLLLSSLGLPWNSVGDTADQTLPLLAVLAAIGAALVDALLRPEVIGRRFTDHQRKTFRLALIAPLIVMIGWTIVAVFARHEGLGTAVPVALTGALLAATGTAPDPAADGTEWATVGNVLLGAAAIACVASAVLVIVSATDMVQFGGGRAWLLVLTLVLPLLWLATVALRLAYRSQSGSRESVAGALVFAFILLTWFLANLVFTDALDTGVAVEGGITGGGDALGSAALVCAVFGVALVAAGAVCLVAPARTHAVRNAPGFVWVDAARQGLRLTAFAHALTIAMGILLLASVQDAGEFSGRGTMIWLVVLHLGGLTAALIAANTLQRDPRLGRTQVFAYAAAFSLCHWITYATADTAVVSGFTVHDALTMFGPVVIALTLVVPRGARELLGGVVVPSVLRGVPVQQQPAADPSGWPTNSG